MNDGPVFSHEAMNTTFTLRISGEDEKQAAGVARECFEHLDYLENKLSRYREGSDVWQINHLAAGESLFLSDPCDACLRLAMEAGQATGGRFDVTLGSAIEHAKNDEPGPTPRIAGQLMLDPGQPRIHCLEAGRQIDLGGIGKGFALDQLQLMLRDWGIGSALLSAGASTQLAYGKTAWNVSLTGERQTLPFALQNAALSASGTGIQGSHILSPEGKEPAYAFRRVWITCPSAALADAWSTAAMLMNLDDLRELIPQGSHYMVETESGLGGNFPPLP